MRHPALFLLLLAGCVGPDHSVQDLLTPDQFHLYYTDGDGGSSGTLTRMGDPWGFNSEQSGDFSAWTAGFSWDLLGPGPGARAMQEAARAMQISARLMADAANASLTAPEPIVIVKAPEVTPEPAAPQEPIQVVVEAATPVAVAPVVIEVGKGVQAISGPVELRLPAALEAALLAWASRPAPAPVVAPVAAETLSEPVVVVQPGAAPDITITVENAASNVVEQDDEPEPAGGGGADDDEPQGVLLLGISTEVWTQLVIALGILATAVGGYLGREKIPVVRELTKERREMRKAKREAKNGG